jgi:hypothetical protein
MQGQNVWCYLNTADATSTSNLRWHAKVCWGEETVTAAGTVKDVYATRAVLAIQLREMGQLLLHSRG